MRCPAQALVALTMLGLAAPSAASAAGWVDATTLPAATDESQPAVAENANGDAVVAWVATLTGGKHAVQVSTSAGFGPFGDPQTLPAAGTTDTLSAVDVAIGASGAAIVAYNDQAVANTSQVATRAAGQPFGAPQAVGGGGNISTSPQVAMPASEVGILAVESRSHSESTIGAQTFYTDSCGAFVYRVPVGGGAPSVAGGGVDFSRGGFTFTPPCVIDPVDLAVNARGDIMTAAGGSPTGAAKSVRVAGFPDSPTIVFPTSFDLGPGSEATIGLDPQGRFAVAWQDLAVPSAIRAARGIAGSAPGAAVALSPAGAGAQPAGEPSLGIDAGGTATAVWQAADASVARRLFGGTIDASGAVGPVLGPLSGSSTGGAAPYMDPRLAVTPGGSALALWREPDPVSGLFRVRSAFRPGAGPFGASQPVAPSGVNSGQARVALGADDHGVAAFQLPGTPNRIQAIRFDATPPVISAVSAPGLALAGQSVGFTATATDAHGPVALHWDFGDGAGADGDTVGHAYASPGARTVTLTATDVVGNAATTTRPIAVLANASPAPPPPVAAVANVAKAGVSHKRFKVGSKSTAQSAAKRKKPATPTGTTFTYTLSAPGTLTITMSRAESGRRNGKKCVKPSSKNKKAKKCTRYVKRGTLTRRNLKTGKGRLAFTGRIGRKALPTGRYKATLTATNAARKKGTARSVSFTIVAR